MLIPAGPCNYILESPTREDALESLEELLEVVADFPFATDAHRSAWIASLHTVVARTLLAERNIPLFLIDANTPRSGKSRLVDCISIIATGRTAPRVRYTMDDDEMEKRALSFLQAGDPLVLFDNINGPFGGTTLDALLTSEGWFQGRRLGRSDAGARVRVRNGVVLFATANNATITGDLFGRALHIRLESPLDHPEERQGFRHPDLLGWVRQERPRLLAAVLTIIRAWFVAGRPAQKMTSFGSFEAWSELIRGLCLWLGLPDPWAETRQGLRRADAGADLHAELLAGWMALDATRKGLTCGEAKRILEADFKDANERGRQATHSRMLDALGAAGLFEDGKVNVQRLGKRLQKLQNRRVQGLWFERQEALHEGVGRWAVVGGSAGVAGVVPPTRREKGEPPLWGARARIGGQGGTPATPATPAEPEEEIAANYGVDL